MIIFFALLPAYFLSIFYRSFLSVIAGPVMADLAIGPRELGFLGAAWFIAFAAAQFPIGWALDRLGPRRTVTAAMAIGTVGGGAVRQRLDGVVGHRGDGADRHRLLADLHVGAVPVCADGGAGTLRLPDFGVHRARFARQSGRRGAAGDRGGTVRLASVDVGNGLRFRRSPR